MSTKYHLQILAISRREDPRFRYSVNMIWFLLATVLVSCEARKLSYTDDGEICMSDCVPYGQYRYCWMGWGKRNWDYCTLGEFEARTYFTSFSKFNTDNKVACTSECGKYSYDYNWCFAGDEGKWDYCSPEEGVSAYGNRCIKPCEKNRDGFYFCETGPQRIEICSPNPVNYSFFQEMHSVVGQMKGQCSLDIAGQGRRKRLSENVVRNIGVEELAARYERRYLNDRHFLQTPATSATSYVAPLTPPDRHRNLMREPLTLVVRATIRHQHVQAAQQQGRENIPSYIAVRMENMDRCEGDEQGHLLAASLLGPTQAFNFLPQSPLANRGAGGTNYWFAVENDIRTLLNNNPGYRIEWTLVVTYGDLERSRRPTGFGLRFRTFDANGNQVRDSGNCYFSNDPSGGCPI